MSKKTVWVSGGSRGIGAAAVREFAESGWSVAFTYRNAVQEAEALEQSLCEAGAQVMAVQGDMTVREEVTRCYQQIRERFSVPDALVCNAGIAQQKMFCDLTDEDWETMFEGNVRSTYLCVQAALGDMVHRKQGSMVLVSSVWGAAGASCESHYAASKGALIALGKSLAKELGPSGIRINCVLPGVIDTAMNEMHDTETMSTLAEETPLGRIGTPQEVAQAIAFLCSQQASFITGQTLGVDGGFGV